MENEQKPRILIVDDDELGNRLLRSVFEANGFEVMSAFDGLEGLDLATKHLPNVIVSGIVMPRMSGFEMIKNLKNNLSTVNIPIIIYSHLGRQEDEQQSKALGIQEFVVRDLTPPSEIVEKARKLLPHSGYFYIKFDPQDLDAKLLANSFRFPPYFECPDGGRMKLRLEYMGSKNEETEFKAVFICE